MKRFSAFLLIVLFAVCPLVSSAAATPEPGGANQMRGVEGKVGAQTFNGELRVKITEVAIVPGVSTQPDSVFIVVRGIASNGTAKPYSGQNFQASIADANGITVQTAKSWGVNPKVDYLPAVTSGISNVPPGAAWKFQIPFLVSKDFVPTKVILNADSPKYKAFRISIGATDVKT